MKTLKKYIGILSLTMILSALGFHGCKKSESSVNSDITFEQAKAAAVKAVQDKYGNVSVPEVYPVNKTADGFYINSNGQEIPVKQKSGIQSIQSCNMDCNTASDPSELDLVYTLSFVQRFFYCGSTTGSEVTATWQISVPYTVLAQNPYNATLKSKGRMRFKSSAGAILVTNTNLQPVTITPNGADPNCASNFLYTVTYKWVGVADSYFANGNVLECSLFAYNDCDLTANNYLTSWVTAMIYPGGGTYAQPCNRIDKVWVNPASGPNNCATAAGAYVTCPSYPGGFTPTNSQQVEYRKRDNAGSFNWTDQSSTVYNGTVPGTGATSNTVLACCGVLYLNELRPGNGAPNGWLVRYKNVHTGCPASAPVNTTWTNGTYITEYWAIF